MHFVPQTTLPPVPGVSPECRVGTAHQRRAYPAGAASPRRARDRPAAMEWLGRVICSTKAPRQGVVATRLSQGSGVGHERSDFPPCAFRPYRAWSDPAQPPRSVHGFPPRLLSRSHLISARTESNHAASTVSVPMVCLPDCHALDVRELVLTFLTTWQQVNISREGG
jgi:hypothetical protein